MLSLPTHVFLIFHHAVFFLDLMLDVGADDAVECSEEGGGGAGVGGTVGGFLAGVSPELDHDQRGEAHEDQQRNDDGDDFHGWLQFSPGSVTRG